MKTDGGGSSAFRRRPRLTDVAEIRTTPRARRRADTRRKNTSRRRRGGRVIRTVKALPPHLLPPHRTRGVQYDRQTGGWRPSTRAPDAERRPDGRRCAEHAACPKKRHANPTPGRRYRRKTVAGVWAERAAGGRLGGGRGEKKNHTADRAAAAGRVRADVANESRAFVRESCLPFPPLALLLARNNNNRHGRRAGLLVYYSSRRPANGTSVMRCARGEGGGVSSAARGPGTLPVASEFFFQFFVRCTTIKYSGTIVLRCKSLATNGFHLSVFDAANNRNSLRARRRPTPPPHSPVSIVSVQLFRCTGTLQ